MAQFQKGSPKSLTRNLGIMYGYIGADDFDVVPVITLVEGKKAILTMIDEGAASSKRGEEIYHAMEGAGVCQDMQAVADMIVAMALPNDFYSRVELQCEHCDECSTIHGRLVDKVSGIQTKLDIDDLVSALELCDDFFQDNLITLGEAVYILKEVIEKIPLEAKENNHSSAPN